LSPRDHQNLKPEGPFECSYCEELNFLSNWQTLFEWFNKKIEKKQKQSSKIETQPGVTSLASLVESSNSGFRKVGPEKFGFVAVDCCQEAFQMVPVRLLLRASLLKPNHRRAQRRFPQSDDPADSRDFAKLKHHRHDRRSRNDRRVSSGRFKRPCVKPASMTANGSPVASSALPKAAASRFETDDN